MNTEVRRRRRRTDDYKDVRPVTSLPGASEVVPVDHVTTLVRQYTGQSIPLDRLYPEPPPPTSNHPALSRAANTVTHNPDGVDVSRRNHRVTSDEAYRKEVRIRTLHRMILRNASMAQAASVMGITVPEVHALRRELFKRMSQDAAGVDVTTLFGMTVNDFNEIRGEAMRRYDAVPDLEQVVSDGRLVDGTSPNKDAMRDRARFLVIAMGAENSKQRFYQSTGVHDEIRNRRPYAAGDEEDAGAVMMAKLRDMFSEMMDPALAEARLAAVTSGDEFNDILDGDDTGAGTGHGSL